MSQPNHSKGLFSPWIASWYSDNCQKLPSKCDKKLFTSQILPSIRTSLNIPRRITWYRLICCWFFPCSVGFIGQPTSYSCNSSGYSFVWIWRNKPTLNIECCKWKSPHMRNKRSCSTKTRLFFLQKGSWLRTKNFPPTILFDTQDDLLRSIVWH